MVKEKLISKNFYNFFFKDFFFIANNCSKLIVQFGCGPSFPHTFAFSPKNEFELTRGAARLDDRKAFLQCPVSFCATNQKNPIFLQKCVMLLFYLYCVFVM